MSEEQDIFSAENKSKPNFVKLDTVGQTWKGVYVSKNIQPNALETDGSLQTVYTLVEDSGELLFVGGRTAVITNGKKNKIIAGLEAAKFGEYVGLKYEVQNPGKGGKQGAKILGCYRNGTIKKDVLDAYIGKDIMMTTDDSPFGE